MRGTAKEVATSTVYGKIADLFLVPAAVMTYLRSKEGQMAYSTAMYGIMREKDDSKLYALAGGADSPREHS